MGSSVGFGIFAAQKMPVYLIIGKELCFLAKNIWPLALLGVKKFFSLF